MHHERERLHVHAVDAVQRGDHAAAYDVLGQIAAQYPTDRMAVRLVGLNCITQGNYRGGIDIARRSLEANPGEPQFQTMLGFFLEQSGYNDEGLEMSLRSLAQDPTNLYTYHAVGHAYQARGDYRQRARDLRARGLAGALCPPPLAPGRRAGHPGPRSA